MLLLLQEMHRVVTMVKEVDIHMHEPDLEVCDSKYRKYEVLSKMHKDPKFPTLTMSPALTFIDESMKEEGNKEGKSEFEIHPPTRSIKCL